MGHPIIKSAADLVTTHLATVEGFIAQAQQKEAMAGRYVSEALQLRENLAKCDSISQAAEMAVIANNLATAAGLSEKAKRHLSEDERKAATTRLLQQYANNNDWRTEIVYRFLLIRGGSLDGSAKNTIGAAGSEKLVGAIAESLAQKKIDFRATYTSSNPNKVEALHWGKRILVFDKKPRLVGNNIDAILLRSSTSSGWRELLETREAFLACGELKGGIDPAGADEHWKTANSTLQRVGSIFQGKMKLFFVGAAIQDRMAKEIFAQLKNRSLANAANLTKQEQLSHLVDWLASL